MSHVTERVFNSNSCTDAVLSIHAEPLSRRHRGDQLSGVVDTSRLGSGSILSIVNKIDTRFSGHPFVTLQSGSESSRRREVNYDQRRERK